MTDVLHVQLTARITSGGCNCMEHIHPWEYWRRNCMKHTTLCMTKQVSSDERHIPLIPSTSCTTSLISLQQMDSNYRYPVNYYHVYNMIIRILIPNNGYIARMHVLINPALDILKWYVPTGYHTSIPKCENFILPICVVFIALIFPVTISPCK